MTKAVQLLDIIEGGSDIPPDLKDWTTHGVFLQKPMFKLPRNLKNTLVHDTVKGQSALTIRGEGLKDWRGNDSTNNTIYKFTKDKAKVTVNNWKWIKDNEEYAWIVAPHLNALKKFAGV